MKRFASLAIMLSFLVSTGCGNDFSVQIYRTVRPTRLIERNNSDKIIGFLSYYNKNESIVRPVCISNTKLIVYWDYTMKKKYTETEIGGKIVDYRFSLFNDARDRTTILSLIVKDIKMQLFTITFCYDTETQSVAKFDIDITFNKIIAVFNIETYHKYTLLHSQKLNKIKTIDSIANTATDIDVKLSIFSDVSCISQKEKTLKQKESNVVYSTRSFYLVSYDGRMLDFFDFENGEIRHAKMLNLGQDGEISRAKMDFGTIYGDYYAEPSMFNLSVYDGKTLYIVDLVKMMILTKRNLHSFDGSLYHAVFQFDGGLYYYDYGSNSLRFLWSGEHRLLQSSSFFPATINNFGARLD